MGKIDEAINTACRVIIDLILLYMVITYSISLRDIAAPFKIIKDNSTFAEWKQSLNFRAPSPFRFIYLAFNPERLLFRNNASSITEK